MMRVVNIRWGIWEADDQLVDRLEFRCIIYVCVWVWIEDVKHELYGSSAFRSPMKIRYQYIFSYSFHTTSLPSSPPLRYLLTTHPKSSNKHPTTPSTSPSASQKTHNIPLSRLRRRPLLRFRRRRSLNFGFRWWSGFVF